MIKPETTVHTAYVVLTQDIHIKKGKAWEIWVTNKNSEKFIFAPCILDMKISLLTL